MDVPPVQNSPTTSWTVLPDLPPARRHAFRWPRSSVATTATRPSEPEPAEAPVELTVERLELVTTERDKALRRVEELERMLQMLNREVAETADEPAVVWVAPHSDVYHRRRRCAGLIVQPYADGGAPVELGRVSRSEALDSGRGPCPLCL